MQSTGGSGDRGNGREEVMMSRKMTAFPARHSCPSLRPRTGVRMGPLERIGEIGGGGEGLKSTCVDSGGKDKVVKGEVQNMTNGEERRGIEPRISLISSSFTHSWPSFPFPPIISASSYPVLGRVGGGFSFAVR